MKTPLNISFSNQLAYIDRKLLDHASSLSKRQPSSHSLSSQQGAAVPLSQQATLIELEQQFINYPQSQTLPSARRKRSMVLRDKSKHTPPEAVADEVDLQSGAKRRKLCRHDSTASAHTFAAKEPASLRKARSLVAGDVGCVPQPQHAFGARQPQAPPMVMPAIPSRDVALARLRMLLSREAKQRTDDTRMMIAAERPNSLIFDNDLHLFTVEWLLSVQGPAGDVCQQLRRHLRASLETRFHAVWLFNRYATRLPSARFNPFLMPLEQREDAYQHQLRGKLVREIALGCLAIAAKFHHDFLPPLKPLTAEQFLHALGEEHPVTFDNFELMQNTILKSFNYIVYQPTSQAYLQEIWKACSTLHIIQDSALDLWRTNVRTRVLEFIETCLHEQDAMSYSVAHLTAGALLEALHVQEMHRQCVDHSDSQYWAQNVVECMETPDEMRVCVACVSNEICDAMGIARNALLNCRDWIMTVWVGEIAEQ
ncbi:hypothetical protein FRC07_014545 [Ceratobasidium sp. 392]|nr:hypothetical protein FRC07_014545 [Ceratobasidium sp. 392]